jgi:hypothetical protein
MTNNLTNHVSWRRRRRRKKKKKKKKKKKRAREIKSNDS